MQFEIRAFKANEGVVALKLDAADESSAREQARAQGLTVLSARRRGIGLDFAHWPRPRFPLLLFSQELLALLSAGLSLIEVLETMAEKETRPEVRKVIVQLTEALYQGRSERFPRSSRSSTSPPCVRPSAPATFPRPLLVTSTIKRASTPSRRRWFRLRSIPPC